MRGCFTLASTHPHRQKSHTSFPPAHPSCSEPSTVSASPVRFSLPVSERRDPSRFFFSFLLSSSFVVLFVSLQALVCHVAGGSAQRKTMCPPVFGNGQRGKVEQMGCVQVVTGGWCSIIIFSSNSCLYSSRTRRANLPWSHCRCSMRCLFWLNWFITWDWSAVILAYPNFTFFFCALK